MAHWPRGATCTSAPRGQCAMPLAVRSSEGLGLTVVSLANARNTRDSVAAPFADGYEPKKHTELVGHCDIASRRRNVFGTAFNGTRCFQKNREYLLGDDVLCLDEFCLLAQIPPQLGECLLVTVSYTHLTLPTKRIV